MTIQEFEIELQGIDPKFQIIQHPNNPELAGVYYDKNDANKTGFVVTVPSKEIHEDFNKNYVDITGHPHNSASRVRFICKEHLKRLADNEEYKKTFYAKIPN